MDKLKKQLEQMSRSDEIYKKIIEIGNRHNLPIDLEGDLYAEVGNVICGFKQAKDLVKNLKERLEISDAEASSIASDVSKEIFSTIREKLRKMQEEEEREIASAVSKPKVEESPVIAKKEIEVVVPPIIKPFVSSVPMETRTETLRQAVPEQGPTQIPISKTISNIERVGQFKIEQDPPSSSSQYKEEDINRDDLLKNIEDAPVPLVEHILSNPIINSNKIETGKEIPKKSVDNKSYSLDPYRELI